MKGKRKGLEHFKSSKPLFIYRKHCNSRLMKYEDDLILNPSHPNNPTNPSSDYTIGSL